MARLGSVRCDSRKLLQTSKIILVGLREMDYRRDDDNGVSENRNHLLLCGEAQEREKPMAVYALSETEAITDPQILGEYVQRIGPIFKKYGVKLLVAGPAEVEIIEGNWQPQGMTILEFADREHFEGFYNSPEYQELLPLRMQATSSRSILIKPAH